MNAPGAAKPDTYSQEPVTLTVYFRNASVLTDADLEEPVTKAIKAKYPNITSKLLTGDLEKLVSAGETPDVVLSALQFVPKILQLGIYSDLNDFIKQEKIDLGKFEPEAVRVTKSFSDMGEIVGMPYAMSCGCCWSTKTYSTNLRFRIRRMACPGARWSSLRPKSPAWIKAAQ